MFSQIWPTFFDFYQHILTRPLWRPTPKHPVWSVQTWYTELPSSKYAITIFFRQHLKAAPAFVSAYLLRLQCQSAGSLKIQECIISRGYSCGPRGFNSITILSSHLFLHFPSDILPMTTNEEIVALNLTYFLMFSLIDVTFANQPLDWTGYQYSKQTTRMITSSIFKFLTWVPQHLLVLRFSLYLNI